jgi:tetratricopeptide (TPR) repeat protein
VRCAVAVTIVWLAACQKASPVSSDAGDAAVLPPKTPLSQTELRTTAGAIAVANLNAEVEGTERLATQRILTVPERARMVEVLGTRAQFLGRVADYERAEALSRALVADAPRDPLSFLTRAGALVAFHRFPEALADLDEAARLGLEGDRLHSRRAAILQAIGRYEEALAIRERVARARPDIDSLAAAAVLYADAGRIDEAARFFAEAPRRYRDVSPFPIAWLYYQEGVMWVREGKLERGRELFEAAIERLPAYAPAQGQLAQVEAALGRREHAIALLRPLAEVSDDPDYATQLARVLNAVGRPEEASRWYESARARYADLLARHPEAFADHAVDFWLNVGGDPEKALTFAEKNLEVRQTPRAYELVMLAGLAARKPGVACDAADHTRAVSHPWPRLRDLVARSSAACGRWPST